MKNNNNDLNLIIAEIEELACSNNPGPTATRAVDMIDETYVLIPREILPTITFGTLDDALSGSGYARVDNLTEAVYDGDTAKMRKLAYQYLVMADYVEQKVAKEQIDRAKSRRYKIFKELFPENHTTLLETFEWSSLHSFEKMVIEKMVLLNMEIDKNF